MFAYGIDTLTVAKALALRDGSLKGHLPAAARENLLRSQAQVAAIVAAGVRVYGINTGFGPLCDTLISADQTRELQHNLLKSHSVGVGTPLKPSLVRLMLLTKVQALAQGYSGVQLSTVERILWHLEADVLPVVPEKGSVGASGDLAPLAHLFLPLIGLGEVYHQGERMPTAAALQQHGLAPLQLSAKEGLGLINGTQFILAHAIEGVERLHRALEWADMIGALSVEALMGSAKPFDARLHALRPFEGNRLVAQRLSRLLEGSAIVSAHADCDRVQDPYSLRCMPQVHGASRQAWLQLKQLTTIELNAVTDNPVVLSAEEAISGGNFHGQPLALPLDYATLAAAELGNIADRRCYLMLEGRYGLPKLLLKETGLNSGFMIPQYTTAALVSENKSLCFPASADSIPTSLGQEDHVSMGSISGRKLHQVLDNLAFIQAIELLYAAQALEFRRPLQSTAPLESLMQLVRQQVPFATKDEVLYESIQALYGYLQSTEAQQWIAQWQGLNEGFEEFFI
ncbi:histidine ammonia-lyase [Eisenibacter elegans]|jgi:histidine ammonia-lyase|uniref:histidine ammonia-lyase n=1 Tax=Eisenibacter elegans TaxID=997 RepID=UPI00041CA154|nr:histidine ammonia-lyase [Eisenibacter elegans]